MLNLHTHTKSNEDNIINVFDLGSTFNLYLILENNLLDNSSLPINSKLGGTRVLTLVSKYCTLPDCLTNVPSGFISSNPVLIYSNSSLQSPPIL